MSDIMIKIDNVSKEYRLGLIGGTTLKEDLQRKVAKMRHKEDPTKKIGEADRVYGESFLALENISFEVKKGERVGIIGHNGAGKSTLLKLISRVTAPTKGSIGLNGRVASMLEVGTGFHGELTGRENIYMNGAILGMSKKEIDAKMEDIIEFSECRQFIDTPVKRYSSGMYVKLAFSVAAHLDSEIMIMDEVLAVGDMAFQKKCLEKMTSVSKNEGRTILYVSHNMSTIRTLCSRCIVLNKGHLVFDGDVDTAIQYYSERAGEMHRFNDFTNYTRPTSISQRVFIQSIELLNKKDNCYSSKEKMILGMNWKSYGELRGIKFRFVISYKDTTKAGLMTTIDGIDVEKDQCVYNTLTIDLSSLATGSYTADLYCYSTVGKGQVDNYDVIDNAIAFEVVNSSASTGGLHWSHDAWGHSVLPSISIE